MDQKQTKFAEAMYELMDLGRMESILVEVWQKASDEVKAEISSALMTRMLNDIKHWQPMTERINDGRDHSRPVSQVAITNMARNIVEELCKAKRAEFVQLAMAELEAEKENIAKNIVASVTNELRNKIDRRY